MPSILTEIVKLSSLCWMKTEEHRKIFLKDYLAPDFSLKDVELFFDLHEDFCRVRSIMHLTSQTKEKKPLVLDGLGMELESIKLNSEPLPQTHYTVTENQLILSETPSFFCLEITVKIKPQENTSLEGIYKAGDFFITQCEAQGFRRMTYFLDRPDVMANYLVHIEADQKKYPLLLSNGDCIKRTTLPNGRHQATWKDPYKKPCYLFALVAGDLGVLQDTFTTKSGKKVNLEVYAPHGKQKRCEYAMESLKKAMKWDEERFGREYDLSTYMIVATDDFNAGAMENKGLNIFNSRLVLADSESATDEEYFAIESVVAHEYFHNWTGNRITLRDWFHLSLKEGLTVFRDQEFSMDMSSRPVVRIDSVTDLRKRQFAEDAGPNAHPIRPESCYAVDNFFTSTIYEKGSEVIRMMQTMVGRPGFKKGMDLYFSRHDGQAVVIEDFANCIAEANGKNWEQFKLWYSQAGTPKVSVQESHDPQNQIYSLTLKQSCPPTPEQAEKKAFDIPLAIGLLDQTGKEIPLICEDITTNTEGQTLLHLRNLEKTFMFRNVSTKPVLSLNRFFSAPIHLDWNASEEELIFLLQHDSDEFNRWESAQKLLLNELRRLKNNQSAPINQSLLLALQKTLQSQMDPAMKAMMLELPDDAYILQHEKELHPESMLKARETLEIAIAKSMEENFRNIYQNFHGKNLESKSPQEFGKRRLKNLALKYLSLLENGDDFAYSQFRNSKIMTDQQAALSALTNLHSSLRQKALQEFYNQWKEDSLVINKWFSTQATSQYSNVFEDMKKLVDHPSFNMRNPNRVYSLLLRFGDNLTQFHRFDLNTYDWMSDQILKLDQLNPQVATRVATCFAVWTKLPIEQKNKARAALQKLARAKLSDNTYEVISRTLAAE